MKQLVQELVGIGADLSTRKTLKAALKVLGVKPENIDKMYIELKNDLSIRKFKRIHPKNKTIFLPQCLRNSQKCKAELTKSGYICKECGACKIADIKKEAEKFGHKLYIVPGGSMVMKMIDEEKPKAVIGVGCLKELILASENITVPSQGIRLSKDGCVDTDVNLKDVVKILNSNNGFGKK